MSQTSKPTPGGESHVHHLFGFALGMVAGANATRRLFTGERPTFEDLPQGYVIAGTKLDSQAGDALLSSNAQWFLLELKNSFASLRKELDKSRVIRFRFLLESLSKENKYPDILQRAETGHQFLYLNKASKYLVPELVTLPYVEWLARSKEKVDWAARNEPFTSFLFDAGKKVAGFTRDELGIYIAMLNSTDGMQTITAEDASARIAIAVDATGLATTVAYDDLRHVMQLDVPAAFSVVRWADKNDGASSAPICRELAPQQEVQPH
jgi:hypothetical protein